VKGGCARSGSGSGEPDSRAASATTLAKKREEPDPAEREEREERERLWGMYARTRRDSARNRLAVSYLGLVAETLRRRAPRPPRPLEPADLEAAGIFGLLRAIERFDPGRGVKFETFAARWVSGAIREELRRADPRPRRWRERYARLDLAMMYLRERLGREPTDGEIARRLGVTLRRYRTVYGAWLHRPANGTALPPGDPGEEGGEGAVADTREEAPFEALARRDLLDRALRALGPRERRILRLRFFEERTMREIGHRVGLHETRVCKILAESLERMKVCLAEPEDRAD